jgi:leader peptidase (prepilin peptidase)/N-methyltransferase
MVSEIELAVAGGIGLILGSFYNACIYRIPRKISLVIPSRSICPACSHTLAWNDNIPVLSWLLLKARCRYCHAPISGRYPLIELLSSGLALASVIKFDASWTAVAVYALASTLLVLSFIDLDHGILPDKITFPSIAAGIVLAFWNEASTRVVGTPTFSTPLTSGVVDSALGMLAGGGSFAALAFGYLYLRKMEGLGLGDVKLLLATGALLGINSVIPTIFIGSLCGSVFSIGLLVMQRLGPSAEEPRGSWRHVEIPFGPWLSLGALVYMFEGPTVFQIPTF